MMKFSVNVKIIKNKKDYFIPSIVLHEGKTWIRRTWRSLRNVVCGNGKNSSGRKVTWYGICVDRAEKEDPGDNKEELIKLVSIRGKKGWEDWKD